MEEVEISFEQALSRLEAVVEAMENDETSLEASIALYKEGMGLSKHCNKILSRFEAEVTILQKEADGSFTEEPLFELSSEGDKYTDYA